MAIYSYYFVLNNGGFCEKNLTFASIIGLLKGDEAIC